jgi:hypothetical protein
MNNANYIENKSITRWRTNLLYTESSFDLLLTFDSLQFCEHVRSGWKSTKNNSTTHKKCKRKQDTVNVSDNVSRVNCNKQNSEIKCKIKYFHFAFCNNKPTICSSFGRTWNRRKGAEYCSFKSCILFPALHNTKTQVTPLHHTPPTPLDTPCPWMSWSFQNGWRVDSLTYENHACGLDRLTAKQKSKWTFFLD